MSYPYYPVPPYPYVLYPPLPYDPIALMYLSMQWMLIPYYYTMTIELYRAVIETWRKAIEASIKALESARVEVSK